MAIRSTFEALDVAALTGDISPAAQQRAAAEYAAAAIAEVDRLNRRVLGRIPPAAVSVDGRPGAPLAGVRLRGGVIVADWAVVSDVLVWIGETLRARSPVLSGRYRDSHTLFADDREVPIGDDVPPAAQYVFLNPVPYAHKIEIGQTASGRDFVVRVPNRIYERTADDATARFGNVAHIRFSYRAPLAGALLKYVPVRGPATRAASALERELRVPSIIVTMRGQ